MAGTKSRIERRRLAKRVGTTPLKRWIVARAPRSRRWALVVAGLGLLAFIVGDVLDRWEWMIIGIALLPVGGGAYWQAVLLEVIERLDAEIEGSRSDRGEMSSGP